MDELRNIFLFTDGSVHPQTGTGFGAILVVSNTINAIEQLKNKIQIRKFTHTSSSQLELQTLLWALRDINSTGEKVMVFSDSQLIHGLKGRREKLMGSAFKTGKNKTHKNEALYREFYQLIDQMEIGFVKIMGHKKKENRDEIDMVFSLVDQAARKAVKQFILQSNKC